jgi:hypothetical protein
MPAHASGVSAGIDASLSDTALSQIEVTCNA